MYSPPKITFEIDPDKAAAFVRGGYWPGETLKVWLDRLAATCPDKLALVGPSCAITFRDLQQKAYALAGGLQSIGIGAGDVVAVQLQNCPEFVVAYLGIGLCGAIVQTTHMPYRESELKRLLGHSGARAVIVHARVKEYAAAQVALGLKSALPHLAHVIAVGDDAPPGVHRFETLLQNSTEVTHEPKSTDPYVLLYTSGTAGSPKGVPSIYETYLGNARTSAALLQVERGSVVLSAAPFTHLYGIYTLNVSLSAGATIALMPQFSPDELASTIEQFHPTALFCGPAHLNMCLHAGRLEPKTFRDMDFVMVSGAACPPELARRTQDALERGKLLQLWGMSEVQCGCITRLDDPMQVRVNSVGAASPGSRVRIAVNDIVVTAPDVEGELHITGPSVFAGYLDNGPATAAAFTEDGWFRTGDTARIDKRGNVTITGRLKDIINRGGVKINPTDVEAALAEHPNLLQCAIVPMSDPLLGERACLFAVPKHATAPTLSDVTAFMAARGFAKLLWPERLELVAELPLTPTKKVMKAVLIERIEQLLREESTQPAAHR